MQRKQHAGVALIIMGVLVVAAAVFSSLPAVAAQPTPQVSTPTQRDANDTVLFLPAVYKQSGTSEATLGFVAHEGMLLDYTNASTCQECHSAEVHSFATSNHYQWKGKLGSINDFCGYPDINHGPAKLTTVSGTLVDGGCAACHAGMGEKPTDSNPFNADCLICHSSEYRRTEVKVGDVWRFVPDRAKMPATITIDEEPSRYSCLTCHAYAGGGCNNKRGDMSDALVTPSAEVDVHMGNGMSCVDCHLTDDHRIAGRGVDLRIDEGVTMRPCTDCHTPAADHEPAILSHLDKVACQTCHIPEFARSVSTDMLRDYRAAEVNAKGLYEPVITRGSNVIPAYAFWNGGSGFYNFGEPAVAGQALAWPLGNIMDGLLYPFKLHTAILPQDPVSGAILPVKSKILFETGNMDLAILTGAAEAGFTLTEGYTFTQTTRWMGIFHEMPPADQALDCVACHESTSRIDFSALGYDPKLTRDNQPLCISCHEREDQPDFYALHANHVQEQQVACSECHEFTR